MKKEKDKKKSDRRNKVLGIWTLMVGICGFLTACGSNPESYDTYEIPQQGKSEITPVSSFYVEGSYEGVEPEKSKTLAVFTSENGLCVIEKKEDYYDVTLDYENGSYEEVGAAYAETILMAYPEYASIMEPYLYENIKLAFPNLQGDYSIVLDRINTLKSSLPIEYQKEMEHYARVISNGEQGLVENGILSYEEALLTQMIPDALRGTSCSAMSVWGEKSATGETITARILEWDLGSENQMCNVPCVVRMKNGEKSITGISVLGLFDTLTAINDDGVLIGILDAGIGENYVYEGKTCYTYDTRYALETMDNAQDVGNYLIGNSNKYTYSHNLVLTDKTHSYCVENCVVEGKGVSLLRDTKTKLHDNLEWDNPDSLCIVNAFAAAQNPDHLTGDEENLVRWLKYKEWIGKKEKISVTDVKDMLTCEKVDGNTATIHSQTVFYIVIVDYATGKIQVAFTGTEGVVDKPKFVDIGEY